MKEGLVPGIISIIVAPCFIPLIPLVLDLGKIGIRALPFFIAPLLLIWFPEIAADYLSVQTTRKEIRHWGVTGLLLLALPTGILFISLR